MPRTGITHIAQHVAIGARAAQRVRAPHRRRASFRVAAWALQRARSSFAHGACWRQHHIRACLSYRLRATISRRRTVPPYNMATVCTRAQHVFNTRAQRGVYRRAARACVFARGASVRIFGVYCRSRARICVCVAYAGTLNTR